MIKNNTNVPSYYVEGMPGYVLRDWEVIDYECYELDRTGLWFRGPAPKTLEPGAYFTAIGAAQTFGCFCPRPYPRMLEDRLGTTALNLGYSGAGPAFFLQQPELLRYINQSAFCIVQAMSARSTGNSLLRNDDGLGYGRRRSDGKIMTAEALFSDLLERELKRIPLRNEWLKKKVVAYSHLPFPAVRKVVQESRANWMRDTKALLEAITVPKIFVWFSKRSPAYVPRYHRTSALFGPFPQMVNANMMRRVTPHADRYVECVSDRGSPQPLRSRFTGEPVTVDLKTDRKHRAVEMGAEEPLYTGSWDANAYYPSPEMHEDAAEMLEPVCRALISTLRQVRTPTVR